MNTRKRPANPEAVPNTAKKPFGISQSNLDALTTLATSALATVAPFVPEDDTPTKELINLNDRLNNFNYSLLDSSDPKTIYRVITELAIRFSNKNIATIIKYLSASSENDYFDKKHYCTELANLLIRFQSNIEKTQILTKITPDLQKNFSDLTWTARFHVMIHFCLDYLHSLSTTAFERNTLYKNASASLTKAITAWEKLQNHTYNCLSIYYTPEEMKKYASLKKDAPVKVLSSTPTQQTTNTQFTGLSVQAAPKKRSAAPPSPDTPWLKKSFIVKPPKGTPSATVRLSFINNKKLGDNTEGVSVSTTSPSLTK